MEVLGPGSTPTLPFDLASGWSGMTRKSDLTVEATAPKHMQGLSEVQGPANPISLCPVFWGWSLQPVGS